MILDKIVQAKLKEVARQKSDTPLAELTKRLEKFPQTRDFYRALATQEGVALIAEVKKASPSKGLLCPDFDPVRLARNYRDGGATAISVLTDEQFFQGSLEYLGRIRRLVNLPLLRKDFVIDEYQVYQARLAGADALLLIARILTQQQLTDFIRLTRELGMDALVEIHDRADLAKSLAAEARIIGINNRDLATFRTDLGVTLDLVKEVPADRLIVSESGINRPEDLQVLGSAGVKAVLVGEALVREPDVRAAAARLVNGGKQSYNDKSKDLRHYNL